MNIYKHLKIFYIFGLYHLLDNFLYLKEFTTDLISSDSQFLWPFNIVKFIPIEYVFFITFFFLSITNILCTFFIEKKMFRTLYFLFFLLFMTLLHSSYGIDHEYFLWLHVAFIIIFVPSENNKTQTTRFYNQTILIILTTYALAGFWKAVTFLKNPENFNWNMSYVFAKRIAVTNEQSFIADFFVDKIPNDHFFILVPLLQMIPVFFFKNNKALPFIGIFFILMHIINYYAMNFMFLSNIFVLIIFFLLNPYVISVYKKNSNYCKLDI